MSVPLTSSRWYELAGGWGASAPRSPCGCPGLPLHPNNPWGLQGCRAGVNPSLLSLWAREQHRLLLAAPLPYRVIKAVCGPLGCSWGSERLGGSCGPPPAREGPCGPSEEAPGWQGCSVAASVPALGLSRSRLEMGGRSGGAQLSAAPGVLTHDISCPCLWQQVEPGVPVRSRAPAPPEPPPALL